MATVVALLAMVFGQVVAVTSISLTSYSLTSPIGLALYSLVAGVLTIIILYVFGRRKLSFKQIFGLRMIRSSDFGYALIGVVAYMFMAVLGYVFIITPLGLDNGAKQDIGFDVINSQNMVYAAISLAILPPIVEELTFRGFLYGNFRRRGMRLAVAVIVSSLIFGALHLSGSADTNFLWTAAIDVSILAVVLALLREKTGSVWSPIILHAIKNSIALIALFATTRG